MTTTTTPRPPPADGSFPASLPRSGPAKQRQQPEDADQAIVDTPYGRGLVVRTRKGDGIREVQLLEWEGFANPPPVAQGGGGRRSGGGGGQQQQHPFMMYTPHDSPSVPPRVGDDVVCAYGRGRVTRISRAKGNANDNDEKKQPTLKYTIELSSWRLDGRSAVTCHVTSPPPRVVRKHTLSEMDAHERVELAKERKSKATHYFSAKKDYDLALTTYASAVDAVRNVQHDHTSTNGVRADLVVVMVTCSNNAATCCAKLEKWDEASKFAKNALILLDALYGKRGKKIHTLLNREGTIDAKLFGEWRVKSYLVVARSCMEGGKISDAVAVLKKARDVAMVYVDELNVGKETRSKEERASLKSLTSQVKEIRRLAAECSDRKKAAKKMEKRRAKAMFGGNEENAPPAEPNGSKDGKGAERQRMKKPEDQKAEESSAVKEMVAEEDSTGAVAESGGNAANRKGSQTPHRGGSSLNANKSGARPPMEKNVSFSQHPPQVKVIEPSKDEDDFEVPWYSEHREAFIMLGVAGFSAAALIAMRRSFR